MFSRKLAILTALSLVVATTPSVAQTGDTTPTGSRTFEDPEARGMFSSDLWLMLGAILGAGVLTVLATQLGGNKPASP